MSLLNKIVNSSIAENKTVRRLHDISYSAINGQRQEPTNYKPLSGITKEMIDTYQQQEQEEITAPNIINGRLMKYKGVDYDLDLERPMDTARLIDDTSELLGDRAYVSNDIQKLGTKIKDADESIKKIKNEIDEKGSNFGNLRTLQNEITIKEKLEKELKEKYKLYDYIDNTISTNQRKVKDLEKTNALTAQSNKAKLQVYEKDLQQINRNRLNLQQQPNESEAEYYQRLKEIQQEKYDPLLYKQRAITQNTKELKDKLGDLFQDTSFKEEILKNIGDEDKFNINKNFDMIGRQFLSDYGYNNKTLNAKMVVAYFLTKVNSILGKATSFLQARLKNKANKFEEMYRDNVYLEREAGKGRERAEEEALIREGIKREQDLARRREERIEGRQRLDEVLSQGQKQLAATKLQGVLKRRQPRKNYQENLLDYRDKLDFEDAKIEELIRRSEEKALQEQRQLAATKLEGVLKRRQPRKNYQENVLDYRDKLDFEDAKIEELIRRSEEKALQNEGDKLKAFMKRKLYSQVFKDAKAEVNAEGKIKNAIENKFLRKRFDRAREKELEKRQALEKYKDYPISTSISDVMNRPVNRQGLQKPPKEVRQDLSKQQSKQLAMNIIKNMPISTNLKRQSKPSRAEEEEELTRQLEQSNKIYASNIIKRVYRGHLGRKKQDTEIDEILQDPVRLARYTQLLSEQRGMAARGPVRGPASLSGVSTRIQERILNPGKRTDKGTPRGSYEPIVRERMIQEAERQKAEEERSLREALALEPVVETQPQKKKRGRKPKAGKGIQKLIKRKPRTISNQEKMKNRLRLVASQIEAGNTNPKLVVEVNNLYKKLYNIDNAYMYLKK